MTSGASPTPRFPAPASLKTFPDYAAFEAVFAASAATAVEHVATVYRFVSLRYANAADIVSGDGALSNAGRWNPPGSFRLFNASPTPELALKEVQSTARYYGTDLAANFPRVVAAVDVRLLKYLALRERPLLRRLGTTLATLRRCDFRAENAAGREAVTQAIGRAAASAGIDGLLVPSARQGGAYNLIVFPENLIAPASVSVRGMEALGTM